MKYDDDDDIDRIQFNWADTPSGTLSTVTNSSHFSET